MFKFKLKVFFTIFLGVLLAMPFTLVCCLIAYNIMVNMFCLPLPIANVITIMMFLVPIVCGIRTWMKGKSYQELKSQYIGGK